jgi:palmitoyl-protein thioesterase
MKQHGPFLFFYLFISILALHVLARPASKPKPLVVWHGLGDSHSSPAMLEFMSMIQELHPGLFIHSVAIKESNDEDRKAGWFGNVNEQIEVAAQQLATIPELADGFDAMGFSQGGQFLRAYVERYNSPPVRNLITFGSQHMGVADLPLCKAGDVFCWMARQAARRGVYSNWAQQNLVQAQYFRDPARLPEYIAVNEFLVDINNEDPIRRNTTYARNFASLHNLVLIMWRDEKTVVPRDSSWFGSFAPPQEDANGPYPDHTDIIPMRLQPLYVEDWIGLRKLDETGRVHMELCEGEHMHLKTECWKPVVKRYVGNGWQDATNMFRIQQS